MPDSSATMTAAPAESGQSPRKTGRRRWVFGAIAAVMVIALTGTLIADTFLAEESKDSKWMCAQAHQLAQLKQFASQLGTDVDCVVVFTGNEDWSQLERPWFTAAGKGHDWVGWVRDAPNSRRLMISQPLMPRDPPADWRALGASGAYDNHWRAFGEHLVRSGLEDSVIRLAWEANGVWFEGNYVGETDGDRRNWRSYFRRAVQAMRVEGSSFEIDFNVDAGPSAAGPLAGFYPGDDVVDIIGVDNYDGWVPEQDPEARWQAQHTQENGTRDVATFARAHGKPLSLPEWALMASGTDANGLGDNPYFIQRMADLVRDNKTRYHSYFNVPHGGVNMTLYEAPRSLAVFKQRFGPGGDVVSGD